VTSTRTGRVIAATTAGIVTLLLTLAPSALIVAAITIGALGEIEYARLGPAATLLFVVVAAGTGYVVNGWLRRAWSEPGRRPADVWIAYVVALTILLVGVILIPILIVFITVDSDHSLSDRAALVEVLWFAGHITLAILSYFIARSLFNTKRPAATPGVTSPGEQVPA
jgi:hypothetical protein